MSETPVELESQVSVQSLSQCEPERGLQLLPLFQLPLHTNAPQQLQQQNQLQPERQQQQLLGSNPECQVKPAWIKYQKLLLFLLGFLLLTIILGLIFYMQHNLNKRNNHDTVMPCVSPACLQAAARMSTSTDPFTQPCDFFSHTCGSARLSPENGGRQRGQGIPGHPQNQKETSQTEQRDQRRLAEDKMLSRKTVLLQYLRKILETNDSYGTSAVQKTKRFYRSCLDTNTINTAGAEPFLTLIQKLGGWAVSGQWNKTDFNSTLSLLMKDYATFPFFNLYVGKDPNETALGITKRYIQTLRPYLALCQRYLALLGSPQSRSMIHVGMFISLSSELAVAASPLHYRLLKGQLHQRMTIQELQKQAPAIDWLGCLQAAFFPLHLSGDDVVLLHNLPYIIQMSHIINKWLNRHELSNSGPLHTYMVLNLLHTMMPAMDKQFTETAKDYSLALGNMAEQEVPRWKQCVLETERGFDLVLTHLLREKTAHREAETIIKNVFAAFKSQLHELKWTNRKSFQLAMEKVYSLIPKLWTSEEISGENALDLVYSELTLSNQSFFSNYVQLLSLWQKRRSKLLTALKESADILSVTPNLLGNELLFPLGMFVPPFFHPTYPKAMNYGAAGFLIAKDIFHLIVPEVYSHSETVQTVGKCVWTQYVNMTEKAGRGGLSWLSAAQQQEVWVQYAALQAAVKAYQQDLSQDPSDTSLTGLSHNHLLLTSFSQVNCDADPYHLSMPMEPSFLILVICANSNVCPMSLQCSIKHLGNYSQSCKMLFI